MLEQNHGLDSVLQKMQSSLACTICLDLVNIPMTTKCGHTFCKLCLDKVIQGSKNSAFCPLCVSPMTRRSAKQNVKIAGLVSAVRNVISSIKKDCGILNEQKNKHLNAKNSSLIELDNAAEEVPIRRATRKRVPTNYFSNVAINSKQSFKSANKCKSGIDSKEVTQDTLKIETSTAHSSCINDDPKFLPQTDKERKVEEWLNNNQTNEGEMMSQEDFQPTQVFVDSDGRSGNDLKQCNDNNFKKMDEGEEELMNEWVSQTSTVIFNYNEVLKECQIDHVAQDSQAKDNALSDIKEEANLVGTGKENKGSNAKRKNKSPMGEKGVNETQVFNAELETKETKDFEEGTSEETPVQKCAKLTIKETKNEGSSDVSRFEKSVVEQFPNSKGHNIRFASEVKTKLLESCRPSKLSTKSKSKKSPGWSRVAGARRDLRSKHTSLNVTLGEQKSHHSSKGEDSITKLSEISQESVLAIEEELSQIDVKVPKKTPFRFFSGSPSSKPRPNVKEESTAPASNDEGQPRLKIEAKKQPKSSEAVSKNVSMSENNLSNLDKELGADSVFKSNEKYVKQNSPSSGDGLNESLCKTKTEKMRSLDLLHESDSYLKNSFQQPKHCVSSKSKLSRNPKRNFYVPKDKLQLGNKTLNVDCKDDEFCSPSRLSAVNTSDVKDKSEFAKKTVENVNDDRSKNFSFSDGKDIEETKRLNQENILSEPPNRISDLPLEKCNAPVDSYIPFVLKGSLMPSRYEPQKETMRKLCSHSIPCELYQMMVKWSGFFSNQYSHGSCIADLLDRKSLPSVWEPKSPSKLTTEGSVGKAIPPAGGTIEFNFEKKDNDTRNYVNCTNKSESVIMSRMNVEIEADKTSKFELKDLCEKESQPMMSEASEDEMRSFDKPHTESNHTQRQDLVSCGAVITRESSKPIFSQAAAITIKGSCGKDEEKSKTPISSSFRAAVSKVSEDLFDSPIRPKRKFRSVQRLESSSSSSDSDNPHELENAVKKRKISPPARSVPSVTTPTARVHEIDSEEMKDFERYDENVWNYFNEKRLRPEEEGELPPSDDDIIPGTEEVFKNFEKDLEHIKRLRQKKNSEITNNTSVAGSQNGTIDIFSQDSVATVATNDLNASTRELFNKCNLSLNLAHKILNDSMEEKDEEKQEPRGEEEEEEQQVIKKDEKLCTNEETVNASHSSLFSTESAGISTQHRNLVESEVEALKMKIRELEAKMTDKKTPPEECETPPATEPKVGGTSKSEEDEGKESDLESEELFESLPAFNNMNQSGITLRNRKSNREALLKENDRTKLVTLICTGLSALEISKVREFGAKLCPPKTTVLSEWTNRVTHVVVRTDEEGMTERTLKYLYGVASGAWVLSFDWINDSLKANFYLPEEDYLALDCTGAPGPSRGRRIQTPVFSRCQFCLIPPFDDVSFSQLTELIELCGGKVVQSFKDEPGMKLVVLSSQHTECDSPSVDSKIGLKERSKLRVSHDWIIECVGMCSRVSLSSYVIGSLSSERVAASAVPPALLYETQEDLA